jgi:hypothetical protein
MRGAIPSLSQYVFVAWYLVFHRDNSTFLPFRYDIIYTRTLPYYSELLMPQCDVSVRRKS